MRVLIAAPVRQDEKIFKEYLESLDSLEIPEGVTVDRLFIFHNSDNLIPLVNCSYGILKTDDDYPRDTKSHVWTEKNIENIIRIKNTIAAHTLQYGYDYVFMVDSDLILHPKTLRALLDAKKDIVAEIFWTRFDPDGVPLPNCWMYDGYDGVTEEAMREWVEPGVYKVGMTGACILIHRKVFESGVCYNDIYNISYSGEDRFFCVRAVAHNFEIWVDTHYPCTHLYRDSEYREYMEAKAT